jgi:hypothetical protein
VSTTCGIVLGPSSVQLFSFMDNVNVDAGMGAPVGAETVGVASRIAVGEIGLATEVVG